MILVDTSVWIEYFKKVSSNQAIDTAILDQLILDNQVATCYPIYSEVLAGQMTSNVFKKIADAFQSFVFIDADWKDRKTWDKITQLAQEAYQRSLPACGVVDRMILLCALNENIPIWTLDKKLKQLVKSHSLSIFSSTL